MGQKDSIAEMRQALFKRRDDLRRTLAIDLASLREASTHASNDEVTSDSLQKVVHSRLAEVESHELGRVEHALNQIRVGRYGICEDCEVAIPMARLRALPHATRCVKCQQEAENSLIGS
tara:strand:- start:205 stop:561 length:357 start_codon:yes stop_codon:yes gene_type:complete